MRLRLYHHTDGARVAYREAGSGPAIALLHSALLSHREFSPVVEHLSDRFRVVLPDLPLHGDSEDRPRHPYTPDWFADVLGGFAAEVLGARPMLAGHDAGAEIILHALLRRRISPARVVLMSSRMHQVPRFAWARAAWRAAALAGAVPGLDRLLSHGTRVVFTPARGMRLSSRSNPAAADLVSPLLLISDLGRPERFLNMFRVFKVTSPMSVGSWVLLVSGGASNTAAALELVGKLKPLKVAAEFVSALAGPPLATYTGTLIADTSIPVWHEARRTLPYVFAAGAGLSAGAAERGADVGALARLQQHDADDREGREDVDDDQRGEHPLTPSTPRRRAPPS